MNEPGRGGCRARVCTERVARFVRATRLPQASPTMSPGLTHSSNCASVT